MPTVNQKIAEEAIAKNGYYHPDDARIVAVVTYDNQFDGAKAWAVCYQLRALLAYIQSPACRNLQIIWHCLDTGNIVAIDLKQIIDLYAAPDMKVST